MTSHTTELGVYAKSSSNHLVFFSQHSIPLLLDGHSEERPISAQPHRWGCYRNGPG